MTIVPARMETIYMGRFPTAFGMKSTKTPPCGARSVAPNNMDNAPVTAEPATIEGMTRSGSAAAKGMAPSEIKEIPKMEAAFPASLSSKVNFLVRLMWPTKDQVVESSRLP